MFHAVTQWLNGAFSILIMAILELQAIDFPIIACHEFVLSE